MGPLINKHSILAQDSSWPPPVFSSARAPGPLPGGRPLRGQGEASLTAKPSSGEPVVFQGQIGRVILRPHRPHPFSALFSNGLVRTVGALPPSALLATVRRAEAAKPLPGLDFGGGADDADGADGCVPLFSGTANAGARMGPRAPHLAADGDVFLLCSFYFLCISPVPRLPRGSEATSPVKLGELAHT